MRDMWFAVMFVVMLLLVFLNFIRIVVKRNNKLDLNLKVVSSKASLKGKVRKEGKYS